MNSKTFTCLCLSGARIKGHDAWVQCHFLSFLYFLLISCIRVLSGCMDLHHTWMYGFAQNRTASGTGTGSYMDAGKPIPGLCNSSKCAPLPNPTGSHYLWFFWNKSSCRPGWPRTQEVHLAMPPECRGTKDVPPLPVKTANMSHLFSPTMSSQNSLD